MFKKNANVLNKENRLLVYTALFGDYDALIDPTENFEGCDFVCFTDQRNLKSDIWEICLVEECDLPPNMMNRHYKFFPHLYFPDYEYSLYIDANIKIKKNVYDFPSKYLVDHSVSIPKHFARSCVYEEAKEVVKFGKANPSDVNKQVEFYKKKFFPINYGLLENNIILRRHNDVEIINLMNHWWGQIELHTARDQLSLMVSLWELNVCVNSNIPSARGSKFFSLKPHRQFGSVSFLNKFKLHVALNYPNLSTLLRKLLC